MVAHRHVMVAHRIVIAMHTNVEVEDGVFHLTHIDFRLTQTNFYCAFQKSTIIVYCETAFTYSDEKI